MAKAAKARKPRRTGRRLREIVTPEGVRLSVELADRGERAAAVLLDLLIMLGILIGGGLILIFVVNLLPLTWAVVMFLIFFFLLRNFYFAFFELRWHGRTPGKRIIGLRVIDRNGGPLRADAVFARNLTREVELFIPLTLVFAGGDYGLGELVRLLALVWAGIFLLMPFFNRDCMRGGDMVAGTWVAVAPKAVLLPDLVAAPSSEDLPAADIAAADVAAGPAEIRFTDAQLDIYGILELQTLEEVLRRGGEKSAEVRGEVAARIRRKIGYEDDQVEAERFLPAFYAALRKRLETRMLLGERRESQNHRDNKPPA